MRIYDFRQSPLLYKQERKYVKHTLLVRVVLLFALFMVAETLSGLVTGGVMVVLVWRDIVSLFAGAQGAPSAAVAGELESLLLGASGHPAVLLAQLFSTSFVVAALLVFLLCFDGRTATSLGLKESKRKAAVHYALGAVAGLVLLAATVLLAWLASGISVRFAPQSPWYLPLFLVAFVIQGFSEELLLRGYVLTSFLRPGTSPLQGVLFSSLLFALLHLPNNGVTPLALFNIFLFGCLMGLLTLRTGNLFAASAIHSLWNFAQGCLFGVSVSGNPLMPTLLTSVPVEGSWLISGGSFGLEGSIFATLVLLLALLPVTLTRTKHREQPFQSFGGGTFYFGG